MPCVFNQMFLRWGLTASAHSFSNKISMNQIELFQSIWATRPHVSFISGEPIRNFDHWCFAHVLPKGTYPDLKFSADNIVLLTREEHRIFDQGTQKERLEYKKAHPRCEWALLDDLKIELRSVIAVNKK